jgi:hypothetical protein
MLDDLHQFTYPTQTMCITAYLFQMVLPKSQTPSHERCTKPTQCYCGVSWNRIGRKAVSVFVPLDDTERVRSFHPAAQATSVLGPVIAVAADDKEASVGKPTNNGEARR